ncbi:hypothetical protein M419DRAFT_124264 [Trichoderma reesei RUT C-30]|uniref:Uncharacterized protein n=1 Tax=Hypocrea jecorina (strain ATCC 56765 / BCRC 32924 / NRRL 11460 / Rut C-30) TaxID=1344414 RepID=A0A024S3X9_HYPJR|nr:hypothetical protein M419DRAFT_124264 [Trichoderma reesei RUT C-30]
MRLSYQTILSRYHIKSAGDIWARHGAALALSSICQDGEHTPNRQSRWLPLVTLFARALTGRSLGWRKQQPDPFGWSGIRVTDDGFIFLLVRTALHGLRELGVGLKQRGQPLQEAISRFSGELEG